MRLLISGGLGFIGSNFIRQWMDKYKSDEVLNVDCQTYAGDPKNLEGAEAAAFASDGAMKSAAEVSRWMQSHSNSNNPMSQYARAISALAMAAPSPVGQELVKSKFAPMMERVNAKAKAFRANTRVFI